MLLQIGLQLLMPAVFMTMLWRTRYSSKLKWFADTLVFFLAIFFAFVTARWDLTSYYLRIVLLPLFALVSYFAYCKIVPGEPASALTNRTREHANSLISIILITFLGWLNISALSGYLYPGEAVTLAYPLRNGVYYVGGGGNNRWINNHNAYPPQDYALDIVQLGFLGNPLSIDNQTNLERYAIFGNPVYSPCNGTVITIVDGLPDQLPPKRDTVNLAGNYVLIACYDVEVLLAHLKQHSIVVNPGDIVKEGNEIGAVGNSGNTSQPHLHIHAERGGAEGVILDGFGVPMTFYNRFLVRNNLFMGDN